MTPESVRSRLWREGVDKHVYVILDGAQNDNLLDVIHESGVAEFECLITGKLEPDMAEVAPYLVELVEESAFAKWLLEQGWGQNWGVFLTSHLALGDVWRHLRQHTRVFDPQRKLLFFRYYDPRVMHAFLPTCDDKQLAQFFGLVDAFVAETEGGGGAHVYSLADGKLVTEVIEST